MFIQDQVQLLRKYGCRTDLVYADLNFRYLFKGCVNFRKNMITSTSGNMDLVLRGPFWPKNNSIGFKKWIKSYVEWIKFYINTAGVPDVIWAHTYLGAIVCHELNIENTPWFSSLHFTGWVDSSIKPLHRTMALKALQQSDGVFAVSTHLQRVLEKEHNVQSQVFPNFVDDDLFKTNETSSSGTTLKILAVGDLIRRKNWIELIDIFAMIRRNVPNAELTIIGQGPMKDKIQKHALNLKLNTDIKWLGNVRRNEMPAVYQSSDIFIHTSKAETFGIVFIESLLSGVPVIAYESGPVHEIVFDPILGSIIDPGDKGSFAQAVIERSRDLSKAKKSLIREKAVQSFGYRQAIEKLLSIFNSSIN